MSNTIDVEQDGTVEFVKHPDQPFISQSFNGKTVYLCTVMATQEDADRVMNLIMGLSAMLDKALAQKPWTEEDQNGPKTIT